MPAPSRLKAAQLLVNSMLPEEERDYARSLDAKDIGKVLERVATLHPEKYAEASQALLSSGLREAWLRGSTLTMDDLRPDENRKGALQQMDREVAVAKRAAKTPEEFEAARDRIWVAHAEALNGPLLAGGRPGLAGSVASGARGSPAQMRAMVSTPGVYEDYAGRVIPMFVRHSFSEGLHPAEFLAGTFGARKAVISTKVATARGGDFGKQNSSAVAGLLVTGKDCGTSNGIDLSSDDPSLRGRVLAKAVDGIPAGTVIDRPVAAKLARNKGMVIVRSPLTCTAEDGVCSLCSGAKSNGHLPRIGEHVGAAAAQAISEPVTQSALNTKHSGGQSAGKRTYSGMDVIENIIQSPEVFPDKAPLAEASGRITSIKPAPQGGTDVMIGDTSHYIPAGQLPLVKQGDTVEKGDQLADGIVDAGDVVRLQGLGAGRRHYATRLKQALDDSGVPASLRNTEMLARAAIDHVVLDGAENYGENLPGDTLSYNKLASRYTPPAEAKRRPLHEIEGHYLQEPALHYTIGTQVTPAMIGRLGKAGYESVATTSDAPPFHPEMVRLRTASHNNPDWLARMSTSYLKTNLADSAARGLDTDTESNVHYVPRLAVGENFGENTGTTGKF